MLWQPSWLTFGTKMIKDVFVTMKFTLMDIHISDCCGTIVVILDHDVNVEDVFNTMHGRFEWTLRLQKKIEKRHHDNGNNTTA
jgi:hypothetical protein